MMMDNLRLSLSGRAEMTYPEFLRLAMTSFRSSDASFYIANAHILDRLMFTLPNYADERPYPVPLLLLLLTNAMYSNVEDRIEYVHRVMCGGEGEMQTIRVKQGDNSFVCKDKV